MSPEWEQCLQELSRAREPADEPRALDVLVVGGTAGLRRRLLPALACSGVAVRRLRAAGELLPVIALRPPDLVVLEWSSDEPDVPLVVSLLREGTVTALVPILVLATEDRPSLRAEAFSAGADCCLARDAPKAEVLAAVLSLAGRGHRSARRERPEDLVAALSEMAELQGVEERGHLRRVARLARDFGRELGFDAAGQLALERAGWLHDIGLAVLPRHVVAGGDDEASPLALLQQHPLVGERICAHVKTLAPVLPAIRHHHERWDGRGYPDGLAGEEIPLLARVLRIVHALDALLQRAPAPRVDARAVLGALAEQTRRGVHDPRLLDALADALHTRRLMA